MPSLLWLELKASRHNLADAVCVAATLQDSLEECRHHSYQIADGPSPQTTEYARKSRVCCVACQVCAVACSCRPSTRFLVLTCPYRSVLQETSHLMQHTSKPRHEHASALRRNRTPPVHLYLCHVLNTFRATSKRHHAGEDEISSHRRICVHVCIGSCTRDAEIFKGCLTHTQPISSEQNRTCAKVHSIKIPTSQDIS